MNVVDITALQTDPPPAGVRDKFRMSGGKVVQRNPAMITGIVLHQMDTAVGVSAGQVAQAGSVHDALHRRALGMSTHMAVFDGTTAGVRCGHAVLAHPLTWYTHHADGFNASTLGIEVEGAYPLRMTEPRASKWLIEGAREGLAYLVNQGRALGMPIRYIWAHRQSSPDRGPDPGEELWRKLVLGYAMPVLGLQIQPYYTVTGGWPIPDYWGYTPNLRYQPPGRLAAGLCGALALGTALGYVGYMGYRDRDRLRRHGR